MALRSSDFFSLLTVSRTNGRGACPINLIPSVRSWRAVFTGKPKIRLVVCVT